MSWVPKSTSGYKKQNGIIHHQQHSSQLDYSSISVVLVEAFVNTADTAWYSGTHCQCLRQPHLYCGHDCWHCLVQWKPLSMFEAATSLLWSQLLFPVVLTLYKTTKIAACHKSKTGPLVSGMCHIEMGVALPQFHLFSPPPRPCFPMVLNCGFSQTLTFTTVMAQ